MHIQEAINLVQSKFTAESNGEAEGQVADQYQDAFAQYPAVMEIATIIVAQGLITQNYQAAMQKQQEEQQQAQAQQNPPSAGGGPQAG